MVETAENVARNYGITREQADVFAAASHAKAAAAWSSGRFAEEIVPVEVPGQRGAAPSIFDRDEGIRPDTTPDTLARLKPVIAGGTVTAGNASQQNDSAAACLVSPRTNSRLGYNRQDSNRLGRGRLRPSQRASGPSTVASSSAAPA
jgi:acetyl-CoA C-acetyltransferase